MGPFASYDTPGQASGVTPAGWFRACAYWRARYLDAGTAEDYAKDGVEQLTDAAYARFEIRRVVNPCIANANNPTSCDVFVSDGYLDETGCARFNPPVQNANYALWVWTTFKKGGTTAHVRSFDDQGVDLGVQKWRMSFFAATPASAYPPQAWLKPPFAHATNAAAVTSQMLVTPDLALATSPAAPTYLIEANKGCQFDGSPQREACGGDSLKTGPFTRLNGQAGDLQYKWILAHEMGHILQYHSVGNPHSPGGVNAYKFPCSSGQCNDPPEYDTTPHCGCGFVTGANQLHCLQSMERAPEAHLEGFAHFVAAKLWNNAAGTDCAFYYYKQFKIPGGAVAQPPVLVDCKNPVRWRDTECWLSGAETFGTEYDWLQFFWNVNTVGANKSTMADLYEVFSSAPPCVADDCQSQAVSWSDLEDGAENHFGTNAPQTLNFRSRGDTFGVDESRYVP